ncbi:MAG: hypothetical protein V4671_02200 [Armatimonadota bacterium]
MAQKRHCLDILMVLGTLAALRTGVNIYGWLTYEDSIKPTTVLYNSLYAAGFWWAWFAVRRIPTN